MRSRTGSSSSAATPERWTTTSSRSSRPRPRSAWAFGSRPPASSPGTTRSLAACTDARPEGADPVGRARHAAAPDHPHERQAARPGGEQAGPLLRDRGDGGRGHPRRRDHHRARDGQEIRDAVGDGSAFGARDHLHRAAEPLGLAHAVLTAESFLGDSPFVMYLGDNLLRDGITELVDQFRAERPDALILLTPVPDPEHYGVAELDGDGKVARLVEKPDRAEDRPGARRRLHVHRRVFEAARAIKPSARGELEITDAIQQLVDAGLRVDPHIVRGWWKDTGQVQDMLEANRLILDDLRGAVDGELIDSRVEGRVAIERGSAARAHDRPRPGDHRPRRRARRTPTSGPTRRSGTTSSCRRRRDRARDRARGIFDPRT